MNTYEYICTYIHTYIHTNTYEKMLKQIQNSILDTRKTNMTLFCKIKFSNNLFLFLQYIHFFNLHICIYY